MASSSNDSRPLSPHLSIWRWHATMATSILHRATGVALYAGAFALTAWLGAAALGRGAYERVEGLLLSPLGKLALVAFIFSGVFHLISGVRHLIWDAGAGFEPRSASTISSLVILASVLITLGVAFAAFRL